MASNAARPVWVKQAEEAKLKEEQEKSAAAWEAFNSTFKDVNVGATETLAEPGDDGGDSESEEDEAQILANKPIGPVDPGKCTAAGTGVAGGAAGAAASFVIVTKDGYGRRVPDGGAQIKVKVTPAAGVSGGEVEQEAVVKDHGDGTYTVTYAVAKRGNYVVSVECNGMPILNSPFPVFFSGGTAAVPLSTPTSLLTPSPFVNGVAPNPYLGGIPGMYPSGVPSMPGLSQMPLAPSAAAMAAAQAIMAARAYEAAQAREAASHGSASKEDDEKLLARTLQVSNLSTMLSVDQLQKLFSFCGTVSDCKIDDSKQMAYIEYTKPEEAKAALALNNMAVGGRPMNVEMAKSLPLKRSTSVSSTNGLPVMMQQAVAIQQFQFQQALLVQQAVASQHAALQAATAKTAQETAAARAAEISKSLNLTTNNEDPKEADASVKRSPSRIRRSKSRSPIRYRQRHRSRSLSRSPIRYRRSRRSRSRSRDRYHHGSDGRGRFYRSGEDFYRSQTRHFRDRERDFERHSSQRSPSRNKRKAGSRSPRKAGSRSPKSRRNQSRSPRQRTIEYSEKARSSHTKSSAKEGHEKRDRDQRDRDHAEKSSSRRKEPMSPSEKKGEKTYERPRLSASPRVWSPQSRKTPDLEGVEPEIPARACNDGGIEVKMNVKVREEIEAKQPDMSYDERVSEMDERGRVDTKERRHSERKHRKDEDYESREKRKRRHKHRSHRSSSDSGDVRPTVDGGKSRHDREDGSGHKKSSKKRSQPSRSPSFSNSGGN